MSRFNLAERSQEEMDKINVDLTVFGVVYKERYNLPVVAELVEREPLAQLQEYFRERFAYYRA